MTARKKASTARAKALKDKALDPRKAAQVKGGGPTAGKPVARYHLEHAWPSK